MAHSYWPPCHPRFKITPELPRQGWRGRPQGVPCASPLSGFLPLSGTLPGGNGGAVKLWATEGGGPYLRPGSVSPGSELDCTRGTASPRPALSRPQAARPAGAGAQGLTPPRPEGGSLCSTGWLPPPPSDAEQAELHRSKSFLRRLYWLLLQGQSPSWAAHGHGQGQAWDVKGSMFLLGY